MPKFNIYIEIVLLLLFWFSESDADVVNINIGSFDNDKTGADSLNNDGNAANVGGGGDGAPDGGGFRESFNVPNPIVRLGEELTDGLSWFLQDIYTRPAHSWWNSYNSYNPYRAPPESPYYGGWAARASI